MFNSSFAVVFCLQRKREAKIMKIPNPITLKLQVSIYEKFSVPKYHSTVTFHMSFVLFVLLYFIVNDKHDFDMNIPVLFISRVGIQFLGNFWLNYISKGGCGNEIYGTFNCDIYNQISLKEFLSF